MSIVNFANKNIDSKELSYYLSSPQDVNSASSSIYVRNKAWLAMPPVSSSEQKIVLLQAVQNDSNFIAFTISGSYTVDWGDGVIENFTASATAQHNYDYNSASLSGTNKPVSFQSSGDTVTLTTHSYSNGNTISFYEAESSTGIKATQMYYVSNATTNTFQLATSSNGSIVDIIADGTGSILPYKQAIMTITPSGSAVFINANFNVKHNQTGLQTYCPNTLDMIVSSPTITTLAVGGTIINQSRLERFELLSGKITSFASTFQNCYNLNQAYLNANSANVTSLSNTFVNNYNLVDVSLPATSSACTTAASIFSNCNNIKSIPYFDSSNIINFNGSFQSCHSLEYVPLIDTKNGTDFSSMFLSCRSLKTVPLFDTSKATTMANMFQNCFRLESVPLFDTGNVITMASMFNTCQMLLNVPLFNTIKVNTMSSMFASCYRLKTIPLFNTIAVTNMAATFSSCFNLTTIPLLNTVSVTDMSSMFSSCSELIYVPSFNTAAVTTMNTMFSTCRSLITVPLFNTTSVTDMAIMFQNCTKLNNVPLFDTRNVTTMVNMFTNCSAIVKFHNLIQQN